MTNELDMEDMEDMDGELIADCQACLTFLLASI